MSRGSEAPTLAGLRPEPEVSMSSLHRSRLNGLSQGADGRWKQAFQTPEPGRCCYTEMMKPSLQSPCAVIVLRGDERRVLIGCQETMTPGDWSARKQSATRQDRVTSASV